MLICAGVLMGQGELKLLSCKGGKDCVESLVKPHNGTEKPGASSELLNPASPAL